MSHVRSPCLARSTLVGWSELMSFQTHPLVQTCSCMLVTILANIPCNKPCNIQSSLLCTASTCAPTWWLGLPQLTRATDRPLRAFVAVLPMEGSTQNASSIRPKLQDNCWEAQKTSVPPMIDQSELVRGLNSLMFLDHTGDPRHGGHCPDDMVHK